MIMLNVELKIGTTTHFIHIMVCRIRTPAPPSGRSTSWGRGEGSFFLALRVFLPAPKK